MAFSFYLRFCSRIMSYCVANESQWNILPHTMFHKHQADMVLFSDTQVSPVLNVLKKTCLCLQFVLTQKV